MYPGNCESEWSQYRQGHRQGHRQLHTKSPRQQVQAIERLSRGKRRRRSSIRSIDPRSCRGSGEGCSPPCFTPEAIEHRHIEQLEDQEYRLPVGQKRPVLGSAVRSSANSRGAIGVTRFDPLIPTPRSARHENRAGFGYRSAHHNQFGCGPR